MINIFYDGELIHAEVTEEQASAILLELAERVYKGEILEDKIEFQYTK